MSINNELFVKNRNKLAQKLKSKSVAIINSNDEMPRNGDQYFPYRQHSDMFYLTGINYKNITLVICPEHPIEKYREIIFSPEPDELTETWYGHVPGKEELKAISGIKNVIWLSDFEAVLKDIFINCEYVYLNANELIKFMPVVESPDQRFTKKIKAEYPLHKYERLASIIAELRLCKEKGEIELMQKACDITATTFDSLLKIVKPGINEREVSAEISHKFTVNGAEAHAFPPICATGVNACTLHYVDNNCECKDGDLLLIDFGAEFSNYAADCSRTIPVNGKFTPRQIACYEAVLRVHKKMIPHFVIGNTIDNLNKETCRLMEEEMIGLGLFTKEDVAKQNPDSPLYFKYYMHGLSHFIGLDAHDSGTKQTPFAPGMVLSCEPGIYIKEEKIGIRIENDILVTEDKPINLMQNIPMEVEEIEKLMLR